MIRSDQLGIAVVRLATLDRLLAVVSTWGKLVRPVHPVNSGIDVVLVTSSDLENARNPFIIRLLPWLHGISGCVLLPLYRGLIRNINKAFTVVLDAIDYMTRQRECAWGKTSSAGDGEDLSRLTDKAIVSSHLRPSLGRVDSIVHVQCIIGAKATTGRERRELVQDLLGSIALVGRLALSALLALGVLLFRVDEPDSEGAFGTRRLVDLRSRAFARRSHYSVLGW